jgi:translation initiation factor 1
MSNSSLVYSTDGGRVAFCPTCGLRREDCRCPRKVAAVQPRPSLPNDGIVRLMRDRKGRGGKVVTIIAGVRANPSALDELATTLKRLCGSGGAVKDGVIEIQGDHRDRLTAKLAELGYKVKIAGG